MCVCNHFYIYIIYMYTFIFFKLIFRNNLVLVNLLPKNKVPTPYDLVDCTLVELHLRV